VAELGVNLEVVAARHELPVAHKPDSQDICFIPSGDYGRLVAKLRPDAVKPGAIMHVDGRELGRHDGTIHFTIGQRRGLGIGGEVEPLYVVATEPEQARVIVGPREALAVTRIALAGLNWLAEESDGDDTIDIEAKIRSTAIAVPARLHRRSGEASARLELTTPEYGVAAGQAGVLYRGERLLGGGWITRPSS
jgi:tRNA-specific 2-thiouridylase